MTQLDVLYRYGIPPTEAATLALARLREVYGIRKLTVDERAKTVRLEYDASRLTEPVIHQLLRRAGIDVVETMPMFAPPTPPVETAPAPLALAAAAPVPYPKARRARSSAG